MSPNKSVRPLPVLFKTFKKTAVKALLLGAVMISISACGARWPEWATIETDPLAFLSSEDKNLAPPPPGSQAKQEEKTDAAPAPPLDPIVSSRPLEVKPGGTLGSFGLNLGTYLSQPVETQEERIDRLERTVVAMHRDIKVLAPAVQNISAPAANPPITYSAPSQLSAAEGSPIALSSAPNAMGSIYTPAANRPPTAPPTGQTTAVRQGSRPVQAQNGSATVTGVRVGEHADKVRIVFDVTAKTGFNADLDNAEKILIVELPNARWKTPTNYESFGKTPVVKSYRVDSFNGDQGNIFVLQLKQSTDIIMKKIFPALSGGGSRIVIDLKK